MMLFIIWLSLRLLLLVPNCETMFFLCYSDHFWTFVSFSCSRIDVQRMSSMLAGCHSTIFPASTTATRQSPGSFTACCPERISSSLPRLTSSLRPDFTPFIWLNCRMCVSLLAFLLELIVVIKRIPIKNGLSVYECCIDTNLLNHIDVLKVKGIAKAGVFNSSSIFFSSTASCICEFRLLTRYFSFTCLSISKCFNRFRCISISSQSLISGYLMVMGSEFAFPDLQAILIAAYRSFLPKSFMRRMTMMSTREATSTKISLISGFSLSGGAYFQPLARLPFYCCSGYLCASLLTFCLLSSLSILSSSSSSSFAFILSRFGLRFGCGRSSREFTRGRTLWFSSECGIGLFWESAMQKRSETIRKSKENLYIAGCKCNKYRSERMRVYGKSRLQSKAAIF